ncbi:putative outer membrane adhesin like protein [Enterobacter cloacae]|uniref:Putative outer membrane adhesin like protein n=1 Tax=Enterobacter cloacae TaxID=550 RepID=A0A377LUQ1_ENTCL|nr:putative outer membrane adhesin like protein [Enterobacter cloacae]
MSLGAPARWVPTTPPMTQRRRSTVPVKPGSTITIRLDGVDIGTAVVGSSGAWTFTPTTPVGDGAHTLTADRHRRRR